MLAATSAYLGGMNNIDITSQKGSSAEPPPPVPDPARTREWLLWGRPSGYTQVRHVFVQSPEGSGSQEAPLATFVKRRRHRELLLFLLLLASGPSMTQRYESGKAPLGAKVWMRALEAPQALTWTTSTMSRCWGRLEQMGLVDSTPQARRKRVEPRREDGLEPYSAPEGREDAEHRYFLLPHDFWRDGLFAELTLPELAMFLIFLKQTNGREDFSITYDKIAEWYGISRRSAVNGVTGLLDRGLLRVRVEWDDAPDTDAGIVRSSYYALTGPYSYASRRRLQAAAKKAGDTRRAQKNEEGGEAAPAEESAQETNRGDPA